MLKLFALSPEGKGKESYSKIGGIGAIHSNAKDRGSFYFSDIRHNKHLSLRHLLLGLGYICAHMVIKTPGRDMNTAIANQFLQRIQFNGLTGESPAHEGVAEARAMLPALRVTYVDGDGLPRRNVHMYGLDVPRGFKCDPKVFAQYIVFLIGYWGFVKEGVVQCS